MAKLRRGMRMCHPGDFSRVFRQARRAGGQGLTVLAVENTVGYPRLGLAIAKKHVKLATRRNRLKRIIRESFRLHQHELANLDIVVLSRPDIVKRDSTALWQALERHWATVAEQWQQ